MSRSEQWIGLTKRAEAYVEKLEQLPNWKGLDPVWDVSAWPLREWKAPPDMFNIDGTVTIREEIQMTPWSSGPMYFTCLEIHSKRDGIIERIFQWIQDPTVEGEVDFENGRMWV